MESKGKWLFALVLIGLILVTTLTNFYGSTDVFDYGDTAKFFAGEYDAKIRTSHSYLYGLIHAPFVEAFDSFFIFKITSLLFLFLIIYSVYWMSGKDKRTLWLIAISPIIWYLAPWISPIQLASLLFLWGWYFVKKYDKNEKVRNLFYSGVLIGLAWAFWDGILFFIPLFLISFFYNKKLYDIIYFLIFILIGSLPRIILDQVLFGFALFTPVRHIMASLALTFLGGFYEQGNLSGGLGLLFVILFLPLFSYLVFEGKIFRENKKSAIFIMLAVLLLIINSQVRFILVIVPIILISFGKLITKRQFAIQVLVSLILILIVINPYIIQTSYDIQTSDRPTYGTDFKSMFADYGDISFEKDFRRDLIRDDLESISRELPNEIFVVGDRHDSYQVLADIYFGSKVEEFVSIQDYMLNLNGPVISEKEFCSNTKIDSRRDICFSVGIRKAFNDNTDYDKIKFGLSEGVGLDLEGFEFVKKYKVLSLFRKLT